MGRIMAIDYGKKRTGLAVTDPLHLSINGLPTIETKELYNFLEDYLSREEVELIALGWPTHKDGNRTEISKEIENLEHHLRKKFENIELHRIDESYTSVEAKSIILQQGIKKSKRREKALTDKVSAMVILRRYLNS